MDFNGNMELEMDQRRVLIAKYKTDVALLVKYIPWLESKVDDSVMSEYNNAGGVSVSFSFPVYDATLMNFVKIAQSTCLMDKNYKYVYSKYRIRTAEDEKRLIAVATLKDIGVLLAILTSYIYRGMTKGSVWPEGVKNGVFLAVVKKLKELITDPVIM